MPFKDKAKRKAYHKQYHRKWYEEHKDKRRREIAEYMKEYNGTLPHKYTQYKNRAKKIGILFEIDFNNFVDIVSESCYYCGKTGGGIDRVDNELGYISGNVVPCCTMCNYMKKSYPFDAFVEKCIDIAKRFEL